MVKNQNQYKFKEGDIHLFTVAGYTEIPGTDESFYIVENQFGGKHLLKALHYRHYNLETGTRINCLIDKINCSGKIFLEPENPIYKQNEIYDFDVIRFSKQITSTGEGENFVIVKDLFGHENMCVLPHHFNPLNTNETIKCKVVRIKKGQLYLIHPGVETTRNFLQIGKRYLFTVFEIKEIEDTKFFILHDDYSNSYALKFEMYKHYNLCLGKQIECTVTKFGADGQLKIEPDHPYYKIGKTYPFKFLRIENDPDLLNKESKIIFVLDAYGIETKLSSFDSEILNKPIPENLYCRVEGIRKGKAILSL